MSRIFKGKSWVYEDLCVRLDIHELYEPAFRQHSRRNDACITLRPLSFAVDDEMITECARLHWTPNSPSSLEERVRAEKEVLQAVADSDAGQNFLGSIDEQSIFLTGIHEALQHPVSLNGHYAAREGDFFLTLKIPPHPLTGSMPDLSFSILQACLIHYFSYPPVERILASIDPKNEAENQEYGRCGFRILAGTKDGMRLVYHHGKGYIDREGGEAAILANGW
jgi:hypothetical protein